MICNTSLNDKGEPIINRIEEAINFALRKRIRVVYCNGTRLELENHNDYEVTHPLKNPLTEMIFPVTSKRTFENPYELPHDVIRVCFNFIRKNNLDIRVGDDVNKIFEYYKEKTSKFTV